MTAPPLVVRGGRLTGLGLGARVRAVLEVDAFSIVVVAAWTAVLALTMGRLVVQDTFLALVDGRSIAQHGLPHVDTLTRWTVGRPWTDQQWGAHLILYELARRGGLLAVVLVGVGCVAAVLAAVAVAARTLGGSPRNTAVALLFPLVCAPWLAQVRTQSLALVPFVLVYALLALDAGRGSRRVLFVLPVLVVWANLHGSVALAAGLTSLYGLTLLRRADSRPRALLLVLAPPLCLLASPYGADLVSYYRLMLVHPPLASVVQEWKPPPISPATAPFFASAFAVTALWARHARVLTALERWALVVLLVGALTAGRDGVWFELAAAVALPRLLDAASPARAEPTAAARRANVLVGSLAVLVATTVVIVQAGRAGGPLQAGRPPAGAAAVAAAAGPHGLVLADDAHADWLLWEQPSLLGRVAYDVRFELFDRDELGELLALRDGAASAWGSCGRTASVVTFAAAGDEPRLARLGVLARGARSIVATPGFAAVVQSPRTGSCDL